MKSLGTHRQKKFPLPEAQALTSKSGAMIEE